MLAFSYLAAANIIIICALQRKNGKCANKLRFYMTHGLKRVLLRLFTLYIYRRMCLQTDERIG